MLPIVLAGGATGRRPLAIIAGIVVSFTVFTLFAAWLLDLLGLPQDVLRNLAIGLLLLLALSLLVPRVGELLARPLQVLSRRGSGDHGGGFLLGASLGLVFVPCAGPVLAAVTVLAANRDFGVDTLALTLAYAIGAALPMLAIALAGQRAARAFRSRAEIVRRVAGVLVGAAALAIALGVDQELQTWIPGYTERCRSGSSARRPRSASSGTDRLEGAGSHRQRRRGELTDYGAAPEFRGLGAWINSEPLTLRGLRGRVVLIDFWTYSCINCLRTLPYIREWDDRYRAAGLTIVGVHTPEFAFERVESNVRENAEELKLRYPIALDNDFGTWRAWSNQYWPAKYLIDRTGHVRYYHFGEGEYAKTEEAIRTLLGDAAPAASGLPDESPHGLVTPESYLGYARLDRNGGDAVEEDSRTPTPSRAGCRRTSSPSAAVWTVEDERAVAGLSARLRLQYRARNVFLVLTGKGTVKVLVDGKPERTVRVSGDRLYTLVEREEIRDHLLELRFSPGVAGYAFTFG